MRYIAELRAAQLTGDTLAGHAHVFGHVAEIRGGYEAIHPNAFDEALKTSNVRALINHDPSKLLGTTDAGTLKLGVDPTGLEFRVELPDTSYANDLRELVGRGDVTGMSFGFTPGESTRTAAADGRQLRTWTSVGRLLDVSVVTYPAYEGTDVALRMLTLGPPALDRRTQLVLARHRALIRYTGGTHL